MQLASLRTAPPATAKEDQPGKDNYHQRKPPDGQQMPGYSSIRCVRIAPRIRERRQTFLLCSYNLDLIPAALVDEEDTLNSA